MTPTTLAACYTHHLEALERTDPELAEAIAQERRRQDQQIILIASENTVSRAVLEALGSEFTNKYAEGYPGKRYYGGCQFVDVGERLARSRAMMLFGADHANVQPHSGAQANMSVCYALLKPGDTILSMSLDHGGHLSHGHPKNFSGALYRIVPYGVDRQSERIDYEEVERLARAERPKLIIAGASAYARVIDFPRMAAIAGGVGAELLVDMAHIAGLVAAGLHPSPVPHAGLVTSTTHKTLRGPRGGLILCRESWKKAIDSALFPGIQGGPLMHVIAAKAVAFKEALSDEFRAYQRRIVQNAARLASALAGHGYRIVSGGTDTHLFLVDLRPKDITGKVAEDRLEAAGLTANKNMIPFDPQKPTVTSGLRMGTPTVSSRGMGAGEMDRIATWIDRILTAREAELEAATRAVRAEVAELCRAFPLRS